MPKSVNILSKNLLKLTRLKLSIISSINTENYDLLSTTSVSFIKEAQKALSTFMKYEINNKYGIISYLYFEVKEVKQIMFKILLLVVSLITKINNILLKDTNITRINRDRYLEGERQLSYLRDNYTYILRK
jgi:hypothetical protein